MIYPTTAPESEKANSTFKVFSTFAFIFILTAWKLLLGFSQTDRSATHVPSAHLNDWSIGQSAIPAHYD